MKARLCLVMVLLVLVGGCENPIGNISLESISENIPFIGPKYEGVEQASIANAGLVITRFEPNLKEVYSSKNFVLYLEVENAGDFQATNIEAELMRAGQFDEVSSEALSKTTLNPPDRRYNVPGGYSNAEWELKAPELRGEKNLRVAYDILARVSYDYSSSVIRDMLVLSQDRWYQVQQGEATLSPSTSTSSIGPVSMSINVAHPVIDVGGSGVDVSVRLTNVGGGTVYNETNAINYVDEVCLEIPGDLSADCEDTGSDCCNNVELRRGRDATVRFTITDIPDKAEALYKLEATSKYKYVIARETRVTVLTGGRS